VCATASLLVMMWAAATAGALLAKGLGFHGVRIAGNGRAAHFHLDCWILVQVYRANLPVLTLLVALCILSGRFHCIFSSSTSDKVDSERDVVDAQQS